MKMHPKFQETIVEALRKQRREMLTSKRSSPSMRSTSSSAPRTDYCLAPMSPHMVST